MDELDQVQKNIRNLEFMIGGILKGIKERQTKLKSLEIIRLLKDEKKGISLLDEILSINHSEEYNDISSIGFTSRSMEECELHKELKILKNYHKTANEELLKNRKHSNLTGKQE